MRRQIVSKFPAKAKSAFYLITACGIGLSYQSNFLPLSSDSSVFQAVLRSSRAILTVRLPLVSFPFLSLSFWSFSNSDLFWCRLESPLLTTSIVYIGCQRTAMNIVVYYLRFLFSPSSMKCLLLLCKKFDIRSKFILKPIEKELLYDHLLIIFF